MLKGNKRKKQDRRKPKIARKAKEKTKNDLKAPDSNPTPGEAMPLFSKKM
jgi:hypothetical protein